MTLAVFVLGAGSLFLFASRLSRRMRDLRDQAEGAIDAHGRVQRKFVRIGIGRRDRRSLAQLRDRARPARAVQHLPRTHGRSAVARTAHAGRGRRLVAGQSEGARRCRPPRTRTSGAPRTGLRRLNTILTRMREATRLEQMLREVERERFDLAKVVAGCVGGYGGAYPSHRFDLSLPSTPVWLTGSPDLVAQLLDKIDRQRDRLLTRRRTDRGRTHRGRRRSRDRHARGGECRPKPARDDAGRAVRVDDLGARAAEPARAIKRPTSAWAYSWCA